MSRTACCFLALGIGVTLAAACGDDDVDFNGQGGSAGRGGAAGAAGAAGDGGSSGSAGRGGSAGSGGTGGTGGSSAGTGGTGAGTGGTAGTGGSAGTGGTGGSDIPDAGPDATTPPPDGGGVVSGTCPNFATAAEGITSGNAYLIGRVIFDADDDSAAVVLRCNDAGGCGFGDEMRLCSGPENCVEVTDLTNLTAAGQETPPIRVEDTVIAEGELALMSNTPDVAVAFPLAYIAWGADFDSPEPLGSDASDQAASMADRADPNVWELGQRILPSAGDNAFIADGPSDLAEGFTTCTVD